jgi:hypothetical protein
MYERFTDRARKLIQRANQEARRMGHEYIGTEHILLGLVKEGSGVAAQVLKNLGIDPDKIRLEVAKIVLCGPDTVYGVFPLTPRLKKVIEYAIDEARNFNHDYVGTEHILLGLLRVHDGVAALALRNFGLSTEKVREATVALLSNPPVQPPRQGCNLWMGLKPGVFLFLFFGGLLFPLAGALVDYLTTGEYHLIDGALATGLAFIALVAMASWLGTWPKGAGRA